MRSGVDQVRTQLIEIREKSEKILKSLTETAERLGMAHKECEDQQFQTTLPAGEIPLTFKYIGELEDCVRLTNGSFIELEQIVVRPSNE